MRVTCAKSSRHLNFTSLVSSLVELARHSIHVGPIKAYAAVYLKGFVTRHVAKGNATLPGEKYEVAEMLLTLLTVSVNIVPTILHSHI